MQGRSVNDAVRSELDGRDGEGDVRRNMPACDRVDAYVAIIAITKEECTRSPTTGLAGIKPVKLDIPAALMPRTIWAKIPPAEVRRLWRLT